MEFDVEVSDESQGWGQPDLVGGGGGGGGRLRTVSSADRSLLVKKRVEFDVEVSDESQGWGQPDIVGGGRVCLDLGMFRAIKISIGHCPTYS